MTLVNVETGELVEFDRAAAERRAERITLRLDAIAENYSRVLPMIREAIEKRDDIALGYRSPSEYVADRFGQALTGLGVDVRRAVVGELTEAGLSTRAIAPVVGVSERTAAYDAARVQPCTPQTPEGASFPPRSDVHATDEGAPEASPARPPVTGIDGKTYPAPAPRAAPRRAITDQFFDAAYDAIKKVESLHRLIGDDRFPQNAEKVAAKHRNDLLRTRDLFEQVINALPNEEFTHD